MAQRYHARRKLAVQRMEREVEEKSAQLALLEQENRQLKWQAHILENMLLDMDKQVWRPCETGTSSGGDVAAQAGRTCKGYSVAGTPTSCVGVGGHFG
jgi:hypothetical protein